MSRTDHAVIDISIKVDSFSDKNPKFQYNISKLKDEWAELCYRDKLSELLSESIDAINVNINVNTKDDFLIDQNFNDGFPFPK